MSIKTFSQFVEELELGYSQDKFQWVEEKYEDWGEESKSAIIYSLPEKDMFTGKRNFGKGVVREVRLNQPFSLDENKKAVYVLNEKNRVVRVVFNKPRTKKLQEAIRVRHGEGPIWTAKYWACK